MDVCSNCNKEYGLKDRFCSNCGTSRVKRRIFWGEANYCTRCGSEIHESGESTQREIKKYYSTKIDSKSSIALDSILNAFIIICSILIIVALYLPFYSTIDGVRHPITGEIIIAGSYNAKEFISTIGKDDLVLLLLPSLAVIIIVASLFAFILILTNIESFSKILHNRKFKLTVFICIVTLSIILSIVALVFALSSLDILSRASQGQQTGIYGYDSNATPIGVYVLIFTSILMMLISLVVLIRRLVKYFKPII